MKAIPIVYGIPNCDTVRKARAWLAARGADSGFHDVARDGVPRERLDAWFDALGWDAVLNRRGTTWRRLDEPERSAVVDRESAARLIAMRPSLIKRPVVEWPDGTVSVGFDPVAWAAR